MIRNQDGSHPWPPSAADPAPGAAGAVDLARWLARRRGRETASRPDSPHPNSRPASGPTPVATRASSYVAKLPPAISGQGGHGRAFHAACVLVKGFGLSIDQARPLLEDWNRSCVPPWSAAELEHKLQSADKAPDERPRGYLAERGRAPRREARAARRPEPPAPAPALHCETASEVPAIAIEGSESNPHRLAVVFLLQRFAHAGGVGLRFWRERFHRWDDGVYRVVSAPELRAQLSQCLADEFRRLHHLELARAEPDDRGRGRRPAGPIPVTSRLVGDVVQALTGLVLVRGDECGSQPSWIDAVPETLARDPNWRPPEPDGDEAATFVDSECDLSEWPADELIPARNALVHPPSFVTGARCMMAPTPRYFNAHALDYDFDPWAPTPRAWLDLLEQIWPDDPASIDSLQEWFGYLLTTDTRLQKILMMIGPKRSGRGTIGRVLKALAGPNNVVNPTLSTLARPFGLSVLIDKPVAIFPDARLSSRPDNAAIVESLLSISGEDDQSIDRKHLPSWTGRLPTRFVLISNELPRLKDSSRALSSRLVILRFTRSFYDREDVTLFQRLNGELPGILLWAFEGWRRLRLRGRFLQPDSARDLMESMDEMASPIATFLDDRCMLEPGATISSGALYEAWRTWCREHGRDAVGEEQSLGRDLHAAIPGLTKSRHRDGAVRTVHYNGLRLRTILDMDAP
ncbi:DNA primase family protein [Paludisphaera borealis]|uniref:SF3 helicase domain-containing protein n=1 Tax=Paludisphaera borealis TaxID=1387353 RepID=A0A1U7CJT9_9BACT|nr:phage/plasmid primase, P4 family [Paludisphaera borealis]APW59201.1 hypothetical protein BSF38_00616 [Paludisphaera borealis]